jgi:hypothetical protein
MPQFRITQKFATDCKIKQLSEPMNTIHPLDDWLIDRMYVQRKKVAIIIHVKTTFTFFIPYVDARGAKFIPSHFKAQLAKFFYKHSLPDFAEKVTELFSHEPIFTKTVDRKILGHLNDFKYCASYAPGDPSPVDWQKSAEDINNMPVNAGTRKWGFPIEYFNELLGINLPKRKL